MSQVNPAPQDLFTPGSLRNGRMALWTAMFGKPMYLIFQNWYAVTGNWRYALNKAIYLGIVWKAWAFAAFVWCLNYVFLGQWQAMLDGRKPAPMFEGYAEAIHANGQDGRPVMWVAILAQWLIAVPCMGAAYVELVNRSKFRHRFWYRVFRPVHQVLGWIPWPLLIMAVLVPLQIYIQFRGGAEF